jgi:Bacteriophage HK97-gp10, putative tail-component
MARRRAQVVGVEVSGLAELNHDLDRLVNHIDDTAPERLKRVADTTAGDVRTVVPYQSGKLAASIKSGLAKSQKKASVRIGARVPYAGWIEFGGTRSRPYVPGGRYLYPTALGAEPQVVAAVKKATDDEIRTMRWTNPT